MCVSVPKRWYLRKHRLQAKDQMKAETIQMCVSVPKRWYLRKHRLQAKDQMKAETIRHSCLAMRQTSTAKLVASLVIGAHQAVELLAPIKMLRQT